MGPQPVGRGEKTISGLKYLIIYQSFNGATASRPWRDILIPHSFYYLIIRFNGATASRPWRAVISCLALNNDVMLQWGHSQ